MLKLDDDATVLFSHIADWTATSIARELESMTPPRNHGKLTEAEFEIAKRRLLNDDARKASHGAETGRTPSPMRPWPNHSLLIPIRSTISTVFATKSFFWSLLHSVCLCLLFSRINRKLGSGLKSRLRGLMERAVGLAGMHSQSFLKATPLSPFLDSESFASARSTRLQPA